MRLTGTGRAERLLRCWPAINAAPTAQGRCGYGPRLPLMVISP